MNKRRIFSVKRFDLLNSFKQNYVLVIFSVCLITGIFLGVAFLNKSVNIYNVSKWIFKSFYKLYGKHDFFKCFLTFFCVALLLLTAMFSLGGSVFGVAVLPIAVNCYGIAYGGAFAYIYGAYALRGLAFNAVIFLPATVFLTLVIILSARESFLMSLSVVGLTLKNGITNNLFLPFKRFCIKYSVFLLASALISIFNYFIAGALLKLFDFII